MEAAIIQHLGIGKIIDLGTKNVGHARRVGILGSRELRQLTEQIRASLARMTKIFFWHLLEDAV